MDVAAPMGSPEPKHDLDVYVAADGSVLPADAALVLSDEGRSGRAPRELVDLALGLLAESGEGLDFIWTSDESAPYWSVHLERVGLGRRIAVRVRASRSQTLPYALTKRELDVVTLLIAGLSNAAIAAALTLSPRTVTTHVEHIMRRMGVPSRSAVATAALDDGIVAVPLPVDVSEFQTLRVGRVVRSAGTRRRIETALRTTAGATTPVLIGSLVPLQGRAREDGMEMVRGASLAIDEINAAGGIHGRPLQLDVESVDIERGGLASVTEAMHRLLTNGAHAITSGYLFHQERAVELAAAEGVPFLHASASSHIDDLVASNAGRFRGVFQVCPNDRNYAPNFVDFMTRLRNSGQWTPTSRELVVAQQSMWEIIDFGLAYATRLAHENGWDLIPVDVSDRGEAEEAWAALPGRIGSPAAVMLGSFFADDHLRFLHSFLADPAQSLVYSIYAPSVPTFRRRAGRDADGLLWASTTGTYSDAIARQFVEAYRSRFAAVPGRSMAGIAYDRIQILAQAWKQVYHVRDYDDVSSTMLQMRFRGVNGSYTFAGEGQGTLALGTKSTDPSIAQAHTIFQIQRGRNILVDPLVYAAGGFTPPSWLSR